MKKIYFLVALLFAISFNAQTYYSQNWNTAGLNGWTNTDLNNDTYVWSNLNAGGINAAFGSGSIVSFSYIDAINSAVTPNNLITSPLIDLTAATASNLKLNFDLATHPSWPAEKYSIYITTTNVASSIIATTPVYTETVSGGGFLSRSIDLSAFAGQQVYISFRHYECTDQYFLVIDNVVVKNLLQNDVALTGVDLRYFGVINNNYTMKFKVKNNGANPINSVTVNWNDGTNDNIATMPVTNLTTGNEAIINHTIPVNYATLVEKNINVTLTQVNSTTDSTPLDNSGTTKFKTVSQNSPKKVLIEEGTGTWCGWCPRGSVAMAYMDANYANDFIGIAVHKGTASYPDPMEVPAYATGTGITGFPGMNVDRAVKGEDVTQALMVSYVNDRKTMVVPAALNGSGTLAAGVLTFNASATFRTFYNNANLRFAAILVEDGVTGTTSGYNQVNYYNGSTTPMGTYNTAGNPVLAANMVYDHVGRVLMGAYAGEAGSIPTVITDGQVVNYTFTGNIPATSNMANMKAVLLLLDGVTGEVLNARSFLLSALLGTVEATNKNYLTVYPNPAAEYFKVQAERNVDVQLFDASGKLVLEKKNLSPDQPVSVGGLSSGVYLVTLKEKDGNIKNQKLIIK